MEKLTISNMAEHEKPVEKLLTQGAQMLSDAELLAIILRTGTKDMNVIELSQLLLNAHPIYKGLSGLNYRYINDLLDIPGVGKVKACQIMALMEISKRIATEKTSESVKLNSPDTVAQHFMEQLRYSTKESVYALFNSTSSKLIAKVKLSEGSLDRSILSAAELFKEALKANAANVVLIHNHPSGDPSPSDIDIVHTKQIHKLGNEIGIPLLDHVIIGDGVYYSMHEAGII